MPTRARSCHISVCSTSTQFTSLHSRVEARSQLPRKCGLIHIRPDGERDGRSIVEVPSQGTVLWNSLLGNVGWKVEKFDLSMKGFTVLRSWLGNMLKVESDCFLTRQAKGVIYLKVR